jgi:hypothetical protein
MAAWEAFDTQAHRAPPQAPGLRLPGPAPSQASLSLDRYMQLLKLLCGGPQPVSGAWVVRQLGELERGVLRMDDLKGVLALSGHSVTGRGKQEVLDRMRGLELRAPMLPQGDGGGGPFLEDLNEGLRRALDWVGVGPAQAGAVAADVSRQGFYSCRPLPEPPAALAPTRIQRAATSVTTCMTSPLPMPRAVVDSPLAHPPPPWLVSAVRELQRACQGAWDAAEVHGEDLVGRKVALVLTEDFVQGGSGGEDTLVAGVHLGQVVEWIGDEHDADACPYDCSQRHAFCFVRVTPSHSTAPPETRARRRLDLAVDLREEFRVDELEDLLRMGGGEGLADAWVHVEPREDD